MLTERSREIPWLLNKAINAKSLLDIGAAGSKYLPALSQVAHKVTAIDTRPFDVPYGVIGWIADAANLPAEWTAAYDVVTCLSVLDHAGLDAYGNHKDEAALPQIALELARVTAPGGRLLVTVPVGRPQLTTHPGGGQRVFGVGDIPTLFEDDWRLLSARYWLRQGDEYHPIEPTDDRLLWAEYGGMYAEACGAWEFRKL